ncbi:MAG: beta-ketoacyl-ACP synthase III [Caldicoprobacter oshimai]|uniref:Beta-ketoacyl-[acyl-carrier-protein] synthase III n=1 Tax=Caldicoprobacter faecalis TaxID=937334 RepID=A0A1I5U2U7_9FIRM|nr:beta-ketoacyl-ACP synthase III [Caldicoprobacter faecalis]PZN10923.1 MAG: ketoacyl-ACP synthase III [Caldicoprobacter oshimai]SFP89610.1 3-oxoacyl-[acyl-carrier-protein] synthase III [Caldicoprobacter faecalis]
MAKLFHGGIIATGSYVPEKVITNHDLEKIVDTSDEWIVTRTGIRERRIADKDTATSDLATIAAQRALESARLTAQDIDMIIVATVTPDMHFPSTACLVQKNIGAVNASAFDLEAACSGFLYGIVVANQFIATGLCRNVMVIGAECLSKFVNWKDRNTCVLFGDGAGAVIVSRVEEGYGFLSQILGADGTGASLLMLEAGGSRRPASFETVEKQLHYIHMEGSEVFKFAVRIMASMAEEAVKRAGLTKEEVDFLIPHQANIRIIEAARKRLELHEDKVYVNLDRYGNMSAASIPVALDEAVRSGLIKKGDNIVMVGFGGGLTWAACAMRWAV